MARRYDEAVQVSTAGGAPSSFRWHGQVYRVCSVVSRWYVRHPWWRTASEVSTLAELTLEHRLWRVEAIRDRDRSDPVLGARVGVFDLLEGQPWRLVRTWD